MLRPAQAFSCPPPESVSEWGEEMSVRFEDVSGTQGSKPEGWVYSTRDGERRDHAASEVFGIPMQVVDSRRDLKGEMDVVLKCQPIFGTDEMTAPISSPSRGSSRRGPVIRWISSYSLETEWCR
jgi:hypothetical protein